MSSYLQDIDRDRVPAHVAIVMDGNGRWAQQRGLPRTEGHGAGEEALWDTVKGANEVGVKWLTVYAFSTENWKRSPDEVRFLMGFNRDVIRRRRDEMNEMGVRVRWAGRRRRLWKSVINELEEAERLTQNNSVLTLTMCVNYGGRAEIADAANTLHTRFGKFISDFDTVGRRLESATKSYNSAVGSMEGRLLPQLRKVEDLGIAPGKAIEPPEPVEITVREIAAPELREASDAA